jgi:ribokinase
VLSSIDVIGLGLVTFDHTVKIGHFPRFNEKIRVLDGLRGSGGPVPNALAVLGKAGIGVKFISRVGDDPFGKEILHELESFNVDVSSLEAVPGIATPLASIFVHVQTGERTVILDLHGFEEPTEKILDGMDFSGIKYLLIDARWENITISACKKARLSGTKIMIDPGSGRRNAHELLTLADIVIVSGEFVVNTFGERDLFTVGDEIAKMGPEVVVFTLGAGGSVVCTVREKFYQKTFRVETKDITGAGDVYHGAFLYGLLQDWSLRKVAEYASAAAALNCMYLGGKGGIQSPERVIRFINSLADR